MPGDIYNLAMLYPNPLGQRQFSCNESAERMAVGCSDSLVDSTSVFLDGSRKIFPCDDILLRPTGET